MITKEEIKKYFNYRADGNLIWKVTKSPRAIKGSVAGNSNNRRYARVVLNGKEYSLHSLIYIYHYGQYQEDLVIDHKDDNKLNNKINNLQAITQRVNVLKSAKLSASGIRNVSKSGTIQFSIKGVRYSFGNIRTKGVHYVDMLRKLLKEGNIEEALTYVN